MTKIRRLVCTTLCLLLLSALPAAASEQTQTDAIVRDMIAYYFHYRQEAAAEIDNQLEILTSLDPEEGALWRAIMDSWAWINAEMPVNTGVLPDGLPTDDSLCIVVLGYGLKENGAMKQELIDRLEVALASAEKYPEAYVLCTGGETAQVPGISEAGQMGAWLLEKGLDQNRLILETQSLSTTANAQNSCALLWRDYPQISSIAIVTSDYHIPWGSVCFSTMARCGAARQGKPELALAGNAACVTESPQRDTMYSQAWGVSIIADVPFDSSYVPTLYMSDDLAAAEPAPAALSVSEPVAAEEKMEEPVIPVLLVLGAVLAVLFIPKKRKRGSD